MALYDAYESVEKVELQEQTVYEDAVGTMWNSLFECGDFELTDKVSHSGKTSIKISWAKDDCEWIGFGNSFNNWIPVDMSEERFKKGLKYVCTYPGKSGKQYSYRCLS